MSSVPSTVRFDNGQTVSNHYKAITNYFNEKCKLHADNIFARYYSKENGNPVFKTLTYAQVDHLATNLACEWAQYVEGSKVISYISDHSVNYLIVMMAVLKLRVTLMALSPRNSEAADVNLLEKTNSKVLIATTKYEAFANDAASKVSGVKTIIIPSLDIDRLLQEPLNPEYNNLIDTKYSDEDLPKAALIIHSSGSTSFPKPIYLSNRYLFNLINPLHYIINAREELEHFGEADVFFSCTPLFHVFGFFATFSMLTWGASVVFPEKLPASVSEINFALSENKCTAMSAPPLILEQMMANLKETNDFSHVQHIKYVFFGGAPLKEEAGNWFLDHHFNVRDMYGTTEIGAIMSSDCNPKSRNWGSVRPFMADEQGTPYCVFEDAADSEPGLKHMYVRAGTPHLANGVANRPDGGYNTNDLFKENPDYPGTYTYVGRRDDTLIMENGEKTNPVPMETAIRQSNVVSQVAVLGHGRQCTAALVTIDLDSSMNLSPDEIVSHVHDAVKEANKECPSHSTILPQMVKILPFNKSLPSTDKGTVMRKKAEQNYNAIVEKLYKDFLEGPVRSKNENVDVSTWSSEQAKQFLIQSAADVLGLSPSDFKDLDQSIFDLGLNSLSSIQLRNKIAEYFDNVPQNFLFQHPSINSMAETLMSEEKEDILEQAEKRSQQCHDLANAYIKKAKNDFGVAKNIYSDKKDKVILLTGVTGSLGSFMLRDFLLDPSVKKVYCCIRGKQEQLWDRLIHAFESRSLDVSLLENTDRVEALPLRFADEFLGFGKEKYNKLKDEVTIIQHCAWLLDFNMPVDHYDKECIAPFYNLLKFAYKDVDPMHVHFISSVSASAAAGDYIEEEPLPFDVHVTMPMGYAHSKFIVEILFNYLATEKNFPCYIERLGQVCGDSENGVWNVSEQYPLLFIGGANVMHKMPALDTSIDWITVDYAAATICKVMLETAHLPANEGRTVFHIVNPRIIHWSDVLEAMKRAGMKFDIVSPTEWVESLSKDQTNPAYTLMSFFEANFNESFKMPIWKTEHTAETAPVINDCPIVDTNLFSKFLTRWETVGFYNPAI